MAKIVSTIWNHKKKAAFAASLAAWGTSYGLEKLRIHDAMRSFCTEAQAYGDRPIPMGQTIRKAIVILNYGAHKSKARKMYENYAAPLLNLAGIQTTLYSTNDITKLREYLDHMESTDAVVFAGGDATIYECIQAYFTLEKPGLTKIPVGIIPLGYSNVVYNALRSESSKEAIKIAHAALDIVRGNCTANDVLEIKNGDKQEKEFALVGVQYGPIKEAENLVPKYWYLGPGDAPFTYALAKIKGLMHSISVSLQYSNVCPGCAKCENYVVLAAVHSPRKWWQTIIPRKRELPVEHPRRRFPDEPNEDCGIVHEETIMTHDLHIMTQNVLPALRDDQSLLITYRLDGTSKFLDNIRERSRQLNQVKKFDDQERYGKRIVAELRIIPTEEDLVQHPTIEIDGHNVDLKGPLYVKIHSRKLLLLSPEQGLSS